MYELGKKGHIFGEELLVPLNITCYPEKMPEIRDGEQVVGGLHIVRGIEKLYVCDKGLSDMQELYNLYSSGHGIRLSWYTGTDPGFVHPLKKPKWKPDF